MTTMRNFAPAHFDWQWDAGIATVSLHGAARKNPLTFESYAELRDMFRELAYADDVNVVVLTSNDGNFCSGGDVHDIIGPLVEMDMKGILTFTRMTGDLVKAMLACGKPVIAAVMESVLAPAPSLQWPPIYVLPHLKQKWLSCSLASVLPDATWAPARCCRELSVKDAPPNFFTQEEPFSPTRGCSGASGTPFIRPTKSTRPPTRWQNVYPVGLISRI